MSASQRPDMSRRQLLTMIGLSAGSSVMYQAMHSLGFAAELRASRIPSGWAAHRREPPSWCWAPASPA